MRIFCRPKTMHKPRIGCSMKMSFDDFAHNVFQWWPYPGFRSDQVENVDFLKWKYHNFANSKLRYHYKNRFIGQKLITS